MNVGGLRFPIAWQLAAMTESRVKLPSGVPSGLATPAPISVPKQPVNPFSSFEAKTSSIVGTARDQDFGTTPFLPMLGSPAFQPDHHLVTSAISKAVEGPKVMLFLE